MAAPSITSNNVFFLPQQAPAKRKMNIPPPELRCYARTQDKSTKAHTGPQCSRKKVVDYQTPQAQKTIDQLIADELCNQHKKSQSRFSKEVLQYLQEHSFITPAKQQEHSFIIPAKQQENQEQAFPTKKEMLQNLKLELDKLASMEGGTEKPIPQSSTNEPPISQRGVNMSQPILRTPKQELNKLPSTLAKQQTLQLLKKEMEKLALMKDTKDEVKVEDDDDDDLFWANI